MSGGGVKNGSEVRIFRETPGWVRLLVSKAKIRSAFKKMITTSQALHNKKMIHARIFAVPSSEAECRGTRKRLHTHFQRSC